MRTAPTNNKWEPAIKTRRGSSYSWSGCLQKAVTSEAKVSFTLPSSYRLGATATDEAAFATFVVKVNPSTSVRNGR